MREEAGLLRHPRTACSSLAVFTLSFALICSVGVYVAFRVYPIIISLTDFTAVGDRGCLISSVFRKCSHPLLGMTRATCFDHLSVDFVIGPSKNATGSGVCEEGMQCFGSTVGQLVRQCYYGRCQDSECQVQFEHSFDTSTLVLCALLVALASPFAVCCVFHLYMMVHLYSVNKGCFESYENRGGQIGLLDDVASINA